MRSSFSVSDFFVERTVDEKQWDKVFDINVKGSMFCYKHAARQMIKEGHGGRIVGAVSTMGKQGEDLFWADSQTLFLTVH